MRLRFFFESFDSSFFYEGKPNSPKKQRNNWYFGCLLSYCILPLLTGCFTMSHGSRPLSPDKFSPSQKTARGTRAMVACAHPEASQVGRQVLQQGGNAIDAMVAVSLSLR